MNLIEQQKEHFNNIANTYFAGKKDDKHLYIKEKIWAKAKITIPKNADCLEAMCGFCDAYEIISKKTAAAFKYEGFDYSEAMVELTKTNYPAINIWVQDITQFKSKKKYDVIFVIGGLHHIYKYADSAVQNLFNSLKENGKIVIFEPVNNNWLLKKIREIIYKKNSFFDEETEKAFTTNELNNLFLSRNMKIEDTLFPGLLSYCLWYNPYAFPFLNKGPLQLVKFFLTLEMPLWRTYLARLFSFAQLSVYKKNS